MKKQIENKPIAVSIMSNDNPKLSSSKFKSSADQERIRAEIIDMLAHSKSSWEVARLLNVSRAFVSKCRLLYLPSNKVEYPGPTENEQHSGVNRDCSH